jgi:hypothetical protein
LCLIGFSLTTASVEAESRLSGVAGELRKMQLRLVSVILCLALKSLSSSGSGISLHPDGGALDVDAASVCQQLAADHGRKLVQNLTASKQSNAITCSAAQVSNRALASKKGVMQLKARKASDEPMCSPVCAQQLDAVIVLSPSGGSLTEASIARSKSHVEMLLEHFELGSGSGSLFGFVDISRGIDDAQVVTRLSGDRSSLNAAMEAWKPEVGGQRVTKADLQGIESKPAMLAMLKDSRPDIKRTLLVLDASPAKPKDADNSTTPEVPILVSVNGGDFVDMQMRSKSPAKESDELKYEVIETLVAVCPAIVIDPSMKCGRLRWGKGESAEPPAEPQNK